MNDINVSVIQKPGEIACNFEEIRAELETQMTAYAELEVTEDNIPERKSDIATLRKLKNAIEDRRKEVKRTYDEPLKAFEAEVKKVTGIIDNQINRINSKLMAFEDKRVMEKQSHIQNLYSDNIGEWESYLPLKEIQDARWTNKSFSDNEIISAIQTMKLKVRSDIEAIKALHSKYEDKLLTAYRTSGNQLSVAIQRHNDFIEAEKAAEEALRQAREKEEASRVEIQEPNSPVVDLSALNPEVDKTSGEVPNFSREEYIPFDSEWVTFRVKPQDAEMVRDYLRFNEIQFEEV